LIYDHDIHGTFHSDFTHGDSLLTPRRLALLPLHGQSTADGSVVDDLPYTRLRIVAYGPYAFLPVGRYLVTFEVTGASASATDGLRCEVTIHGGATVLAQTELSGPAGPGDGAIHNISLTFSSPSPDELFEFRVWKRGASHLEIKPVTLVAAPPPSPPAGT
jgi:hypothetical protein